MISNRQAIREFREVYLVSNTPLYLFKRLRRLPAVQQLAGALSGEQLAAEYLSHAKAERRTPDDVATAYACLVAITHKDPPEAISSLRSLDLSDLNWGLVIRDLYTTKVPVGQSHYITPAVLAGIRFRTNATTSSASTAVPKPRVRQRTNL